MRRLLPLVIPSLLLCGCFGAGEGVDVPQDQIYFPVGVALDRDNQHLYVVSSDFDLQYNGGAVQSFDVDKLVGLLPTTCNDETADAECGSGNHCDAGLCDLTGKVTPCAQGDRAGADRLLFPGRCNPIDPTAVKIQSVKIGAFATDAILRAEAEVTTDEDGKVIKPPQRLFVPVRGDSTLHWLDVDAKEEGGIECGQSGSSDNSCDAQHRAGNNAGDNTRGLTLDAEPFGIDATAHAQTIVVTNQTTGRASLFSNVDVEHGNLTKWRANGPQLQFVLASANIPQLPIGVAAVPPPGSAEGDTYMMTFRNSAQVRLFRWSSDDVSSPARAFLVDGGGVAIDANSVGSDSRGIAIDPAARRKAEAACNGDAACLAAAALVPLDVYVANRSPSSLLIGRTRPPQEYPYFFQTLPLTTGPSRVVVGQVMALSGDLETRVFVVCFDSRRIFVYDPLRSRIETEILTGRGPHAVAVDTGRKLLYVGHFTDSYVGVYSLDLAHPATYGTLLGTLGAPKAPRSSK